MKKMIFIIALAFNTLGSDLETFCKDSIRVINGSTAKMQTNFYQKDNMIYTYGRDFNGKPFINIYSKNNQLITQLNTGIKVNDIIVEGSSLFTLHNGEIRHYDLTTLTISNVYYTNIPVGTEYEQAYKFVKVGDKFLIAHGVNGIVSIDMLDSKSTTVSIQDLSQDRGQISEATGIEVNGNDVYVVYDNVTYDFSTQKRAFEGIFISTLDKLSIGKSISINATKEALHKGNLFISGGKLYSQNLHLLFEYDLKKLAKSKYFWPSRRLFNFSGTQILGNASVENSTVTSCFQKYDPETDQFSTFFQNYNI